MPEHRPIGPDIPQGLYDHSVNSALRAGLGAAADPRLAEYAEVDTEDAHAAIALYLERLLASSLSTLRGREAADRQRRLVDRVIETIVAELGVNWSDRLNLAGPLHRSPTAAILSSMEGTRQGHQPTPPVLEISTVFSAASTLEQFGGIAVSLGKQ